MIELIKFGADWCQPCKVVKPAIEQLQEKYNSEESDIQVTSIDIDQNPLMAGEYKIMSIPTFIIKKDGEIVYKKSGILTKDQLEEELKKVKS